jgi:hypothetical protein
VSEDMVTNYNKGHLSRLNYTVFYLARIERKISRDVVSFDTGVAVKRIINLEKGIGNVPSIEELLLFEEFYKNGYIRDYYRELLIKGGLFSVMPRRVKPSTNLEKFIALNEPIMYAAAIATVLDCSTATALKVKRELEQFAITKLNLALPPNAGIQTFIFIKRYGISIDNFLADRDVNAFLTERR